MLSAAPRGYASAAWKLEEMSVGSLVTQTGAAHIFPSVARRDLPDREAATAGGTRGDSSFRSLGIVRWRWRHQHLDPLVRTDLLKGSSRLLSLSGIDLVPGPEADHAAKPGVASGHL